MPMRPSHSFMLLVVACTIVPATAQAQWYAAGALGANAARSSTVVIDQPGRDTRLEFRDVDWTSDSFKSPQYYFYRVGRMLGERRRWSVEFEFVHPKMYGTTTATVDVSGRLSGAPVSVRAPMNQYVARYDMSHGMNLALGNVVFSMPLARTNGAVALTARLGGGLAIPHPEVTIGGVDVEHYEIGGPAVQGGAGIEVRLIGRLSAIAEYKLAYARPEIDVPEGTGRTTALIQHVAFGLRVGLTR